MIVHISCTFLFSSASVEHSHMAAVSIYKGNIYEQCLWFGSEISFMVLILLHTSIPSNCVHHNYAILTKVFIK